MSFLDILEWKKFALESKIFVILWHKIKIFLKAFFLTFHLNKKYFVTIKIVHRPQNILLDVGRQCVISLIKKLKFLSFYWFFKIICGRGKVIINVFRA